VSRLRSPWAVVGIGVAVVVAVNLGLREIDQATRSPGGPTSSSFATAPDGVAAYAELLTRFDRPALRLREPPEEAQLEPKSTLVLLDVEGVTRDDADAIGAFLEDGGRLLYAGDEPRWFRRVLDEPLEWKPAFVDVATVPPGTGGVGEVRRVEAAAEGVWVSKEGVLLQADEGALALRRRVGRGEAVLLSDASPLQNRFLAAADNAAFGLAMAGPRGRPVVFGESFHGYGEASGLEAIPARWWWVFAGLALAALLLALSQGRRFGPPELPGRELPPARVEFAEALARQLTRTRPRADAVRTARRLVRERLLRVVRLGPDAPDGDVRAAAAAREIDAEIVEAALAHTGSESDLLAVGRALQRLERMGANA
jgi:hypothetical protein